VPRDTTTLDPVLTAIGRALASLRESAGLTQQSAAARLGMTPNAVAQWEAGRRSPSLRDIPRIAAAYGIDVWEAAQEIFAEINEAARKKK
jgi:transcriptional regulator with XRE-family HTH domain